MSLYYATVVVVTIASAWSNNALQTAMGQPQSFSAREIVISFVAAIIWIPYFHKSKRVANTFRSTKKDLSQKVEKVFS